MSDFTFKKFGTFNFQAKDISSGAGTNYAFAFVPVDASGNVITGSGGGGAITAASGSYAAGALSAGAIVDLGTGATPGANTTNGILKAINTTLGTPLQAGGNVSLLPGANTIGSIANSQFASTQSGAWNVGLNAGTNVIGKVSIDQTTPGTTNAVSVTNATLAVTQSGTWSDTVTQATAANLNAQVVGTAASGAAPVGNPLYVAGFDGTNVQPLKTNTSGNLQITGNVASLAADSGNPIKVGAVYNSASPSPATGQRVDLQSDSHGSVLTTLVALNGGITSALSSGGALGDAGGNSQGHLFSQSFGVLYNNTSWDRMRSIQGALNDGTGLGVTAVETAGSSFSNITTAATTTVKSGKGILHKIAVNTFVASATITIYDNTAASGTKIATITLPATITDTDPFVLPYDVQFSTGLTIVTSGATDITAIYR